MIVPPGYQLPPDSPHVEIADAVLYALLSDIRTDVYWREDILEWCGETNTNPPIIYSVANKNSHGTHRTKRFQLRFVSVNDLVAFKLRWLD